MRVREREGGAVVGGPCGGANRYAPPHDGCVHVSLIPA